MTRLEKLVGRLAELFGADSVTAFSEHHVRVLAPPNLIFNVWLARDCLKAGRSGSAKIEEFQSIDAVAKWIVKQGSKPNDLTKAREALELFALVNVAKNLFAERPEAEASACYVDAGWKDGIAQNAIVRLRRSKFGVEVVAHSWPHEAASIQEAEENAIRYAAEEWKFDTIYSDCKPIVDRLRELFGDRIRWIPRELNKLADSLGNRRGKNGR